MKLQQIKDLTKLFMSIHFPDREWFIVGGVLRDFDRGADFNDVDVFVSGFEGDPDPDVDDGDCNAYLMRAARYNFKGFEINVIILRTHFDLKRVTDRCDFGINQIGWCPVSDETYRSQQYLDDLANEEFTLTRNTPPRRYDRMREKFPDWTFKVRGNARLAKSKAWRYIDGEIVNFGG